MCLSNRVCDTEETDVDVAGALDGPKECENLKRLQLPSACVRQGLYIFTSVLQTLRPSAAECIFMYIVVRLHVFFWYACVGFAFSRICTGHQFRWAGARKPNIFSVGIDVTMMDVHTHVHM